MDETVSVRWVAQFFDPEILGWYSYSSFPECSSREKAVEWAKEQVEQRGQAIRLMSITRRIESVRGSEE